MNILKTDASCLSQHEAFQDEKIDFQKDNEEKINYNGIFKDEI